MGSVHDHFADYADHHRNAWNKATHTVGIPLIAAALLGLAARVPLLTVSGPFDLDLGMLLVAALVATYLRWHVGLAAGAGLLCIPLYLAGARLSPVWLLAVLGVGLVLQYVGHLVFEKRSPAFHRNLIHTLIGPLWMVALLFRALGLYRFREDREP